jgi:hypothetical protein
MTRPESHHRYEELAAGMALHALEPEDEQDFLTHLDGCALCVRDLAAHEAALTELAYAPDQVEPPPSLLEGIRAGVRASGRATTGVRDDAAPAAPVAAAAAPAGAPQSLDDARRRRAERTGRVPAWAGVAAAAALVVSMGAWTLELREQRDAQVRASAELAGTLQRLEDPSTRTVRLESEAGDVVAVALVAGGEAELVLDGLPVNDEGTSYVLWSEEADGSLRAVGGFDVTSADLQVRRGIAVGDGTRRLMVTEEPGDTLPAEPTLPVLAVGTV